MNSAFSLGKSHIADVKALEKKYITTLGVNTVSLGVIARDRNVVLDGRVGVVMDGWVGLVLQEGTTERNAYILMKMEVGGTCSIFIY